MLGYLGADNPTPVAPQQVVATIGSTSSAGSCITPLFPFVGTKMCTEVGVAGGGSKPSCDCQTFIDKMFGHTDMFDTAGMAAILLRVAITGGIVWVLYSSTRRKGVPA